MSTDVISWGKYVQYRPPPFTGPLGHGGFSTIRISGWHYSGHYSPLLSWPISPLCLSFPSPDLSFLPVLVPLSSGLSPFLPLPLSPPFPPSLLSSLSLLVPSLIPPYILLFLSLLLPFSLFHSLPVSCFPLILSICVRTNANVNSRSRSTADYEGTVKRVPLMYLTRRKNVNKSRWIR